MRASLDSTLETRLLHHRRLSDVGCCWNWTGCRAKGYGRIRFQGELIAVHRASAHVFLGFDLASDKLICHRCDNRLCFNPSHLFIGTHSENNYDTTKKGRGHGWRNISRWK